MHVMLVKKMANCGSKFFLLFILGGGGGARVVGNTIHAPSVWDLKQ